MTTRKKRRVLAVDADPAAAQWLATLLENAGFEIRTIPQGQRGLEVFKSWRPDVTIADLDLADVDGVELVRSLRRAGSAARLGGTTRITEPGRRD
jgi:DNA-binding response OmpR family regulator